MTFQNKSVIDLDKQISGYDQKSIQYLKKQNQQIQNLQQQLRINELERECAYSQLNARYAEEQTKKESLEGQLAKSLNQLEQSNLVMSQCSEQLDTLIEKRDLIKQKEFQDIVAAESIDRETAAVEERLHARTQVYNQMVEKHAELHDKALSLEIENAEMIRFLTNGTAQINDFQQKLEKLKNVLIDKDFQVQEMIKQRDHVRQLLYEQKNILSYQNTQLKAQQLLAQHLIQESSQNISTYSQLVPRTSLSANDPTNASQPSLNIQHSVNTEPNILLTVNPNNYIQTNKQVQASNIGPQDSQEQLTSTAVQTGSYDIPKPEPAIDKVLKSSIVCGCYAEKIVPVNAKNTYIRHVQPSKINADSISVQRLVEITRQNRDIVAFQLEE